MPTLSPIILGSVTLDENIVQGKRFRKIGGVPVYAGMTYKKLGIDPLIVCNFGNQDKHIPRFFKKQGIAFIHGVSEYTTRFINEYHEEKRSQRLLSVANPIRPEQIHGVISKIKHIHFGPLHPNDIDPVIFNKNLDVQFITLDIQGLTRFIQNDTIKPKVSPIITDALKIAHIIKADNSELAITLKYLKMTISEMMREFQLQEIVETRADSGGLIYTPDGTFSYSACPKKQIIDTTGAGDVFFAAYLVSRIYKNQDISTACKFAAAIAARHIEGNLWKFNLLLL